jgi:hypothetical protein
MSESLPIPGSRTMSEDVGNGIVNMTQDEMSLN